jgi:hypothetical protein
MKFPMTGQEKGDLLIEVTVLAGLTVHQKDENCVIKHPLNTTLPCVLYKQLFLSLFMISHDGYITFYAGKWMHENCGDFGKLQIRNISFFYFFAYLLLSSQNG